MNDLQNRAEAWVALLAGALLIALTAERLNLPYTVALLVVGVASSAFHALHTPFTFTPTILFLFLPALIFEAALNLDLESLRRMWRPTAMLALPGVILTVAVIAGGLTLSNQLPFAAAFVLGTIVAATDPIAVIATFRRLSVPLDLQTIVEAESLANDGVAVVLYTVAIGASASISGLELGRLAGRTCYDVVAAVAIGVAGAFLVAHLVRGVDDAAYFVVGTIVLAYGSYAAASVIGASGIFASAAAGIALPAFERLAPREEIRRGVESFWSAIALLANALIFLLMGIALSIERIAHEPSLVALSIGLLIVARLALSYGFLPLAGIGKVLISWQHVVAFAGMRGGLSLALALGLPDDLPNRPQIIDAVFAVVLVTLVAQGLAIEPLLRRLRLGPAAKYSLPDEQG